MDFETALAKFMEYITISKQEYIAQHFSRLTPPTYSLERGIKNIRVVSTDADGMKQRSVFCFIRIDDGAVLKAAGWKAPAKHARGTIFTDDPSKYGVSTYGANYL